MLNLDVRYEVDREEKIGMGFFSDVYGASSTSCDPPWFFVSPYAKNGSLPEYLRRLQLEHGGFPVPLTQSVSSASVRKSSPARDSLFRSSLTGSFTGRYDRSPGVGDIPKEWDLYRFMHEIAKGMEYLHNVKVVRGEREMFGVLHGDLKVHIPAMLAELN